jgi:MOSC domain-containing protein YiiM
MAGLLSVNVGLPRDVSWQSRMIYTSVWKYPVSGRRLVKRLDVAGDAQGDLNGHGSEHRAVLVYQIESYRYWEAQLGRTGFTYGQFGENFTIENLADDEVSIGDRYKIGSALFEVTQPRVTCYRVGIRMEEPRMAALLISHHRPGFYLRVLQEGEVGAGDEIIKVADGPERMTVNEIDALLYLPGHPASNLERALRIAALSEGWKGSSRALLDQARGSGLLSSNPRPGAPSEPTARVAGLSQATCPPSGPGERDGVVANRRSNRRRTPCDAASRSVRRAAAAHEPRRTAAATQFLPLGRTQRGPVLIND